MAINRLAISNASANTDTVLYTSVRNCLTSVIATNKSNSQSLIRIWIVPAGQSGDSTKWMHIAYDSIVTGNNSLETFRFPLENGDLVYVRADSANISFSISGIYENSGAQKVYYDSTAPGAPSIGDIWVNSGASYANTNTSAVIAYQAAEPITKSPNLLWVDSSGNSTVYANQYGVTGNWDVRGGITATPKSGYNPTDVAGGWLKAALSVSGSWGGGLSMLDGSAGWNIRAQENGANLRFSAGTTSSTISDVLTLQNNGNIMMGTAITADTLRYFDIYNTHSGNSAGAIIRLITNNAANTAVTTVDLVKYRNGNFVINNNDSSGTIIFNNAGTEKMRISSAGGVGIGTSSPSYLLSINAGPVDQWHMQMGNLPNGQQLRLAGYAGTNKGIIGAYADDSNSNPRDLILERDGGSVLIGTSTNANSAYKLQVNSQIFATSSTVATSDGRYKQNVNDISGGLNIINSLRPVSFDWKAHQTYNFPEGKTIGFIAQEVKESLRDYEWVDNLVKTNYNEDLDEEFLGIAEGNIIPLLVSAVKELKAEVEILKGQING